MAWTGTNPVAVGGSTKKSDYDAVFDNTSYLETTVLGSPNANSDGVTLKWKNNSSHYQNQNAGADDGQLVFGAGSSAGLGGQINLFGEDHATNAGEVILQFGGTGLATGASLFRLRCRDSGGGGQFYDVLQSDGTSIEIGVDAAGDSLPIFLTQNDSSMVLRGGTSSTTGAGLVLEGDDFGGVGAGGKAILRAGTANVVEFKGAGGNISWWTDVQYSNLIYIKAGNSDLQVYDSADTNFVRILSTATATYMYSSGDQFDFTEPVRVPVEASEPVNQGTGALHVKGTTLLMYNGTNWTNVFTGGTGTWASH